MMRLTIRHAVAAILASLCLLFTPCDAQAPHASATVAATVSLEKNIITQHEPVIVDLTFNNHSQQGVSISLGYEDEKMDVKVTDPEGLVFRKPRPTVRQGWGSVDAFNVPKGASAIGPVVLNNWFTFEKLGTYQIEVTLSSASLPKEAFYYKIQSEPATLELTVAQRDGRSLESACANLLARTQGTQSYTDSLAAAKALATVNDPIAIPFLAEAVKRREFASLMISALVRLKTHEAVIALVAASKSDDPETSALAQAALTNLQETEKR